MAETFISVKRTALGVLTWLFLSANSSASFASPSTEPSGTEKSAPASMAEKVLDPDANRFNARAKLGYIAAKKIPDVCAKLFCYCGCDMTDNHVSLLDCFTSDHGADCSICVDEAILAYKMIHDNKSVAEIQKAVDLQFVPAYNEIFTQPSDALVSYRAHRLWTPSPAEVLLEKRTAAQVEQDRKAQPNQADVTPVRKNASKPGACCGKHK